MLARSLSKILTREKSTLLFNIFNNEISDGYGYHFSFVKILYFLINICYN